MIPVLLIKNDRPDIVKNSVEGSNQGFQQKFQPN